MANCNTSIRKESATQLLARLSGRPSIVDLDKTIFDNLDPGAIVEVNGEAGSGKTELLYSWIINCILPPSWKESTVGGLKASVIFVDNDYKLSVSRISILMKHRIEQAVSVNGKNIKCEDEEIENLIKDSLSRLLIVSCETSDEFLMTLLSFKNFILSNNKISLLIVDSISSFYWIDRMNNMDNFKYLEDHHKKFMVIIKELADELKINIILTKQNLMQSKTISAERFGSSSKRREFEFMGRYYAKIINYKVSLNNSSILFDNKTVIKVISSLCASNKVNQKFLTITDTFVSVS